MRIQRVDAEGFLDAPLVLIGEAPGEQENKRGRPFVGRSGYQLGEWWHEVGLTRQDFFILNVFPYMCPQSKVENGNKREIAAWADTLYTRLARAENPIVIVPTGNLALRALKRQPLWGNYSPKITDWRGSIFPITLNGHTVKVIPTIHPAAVLRDPSLNKICRADWARIAHDVQFRDLRLPKRTRHIPPVPPEITTTLRAQCAERDTVCAIDIETKPKSRRITVVGFSTSHEWSATYKWPEDAALIKHLCASPCRKVGQNFLYDRFWLYWEGIDVCGPIYDILAMHHTLDSTLPHDLASMASLDTREPYWKRSWKDEDSDAEDKTPFDELCLYNGTDACVTRELFDTYYGRLRAR